MFTQGGISLTVFTSAFGIGIGSKVMEKLWKSHGIFFPSFCVIPEED